MAPDMCQGVSAELGEQLSGTAPRTSRWVLLEHGGPWGRDALTDAAFPVDVVASIGGALARTGARFQLIRRHRAATRGPGATLMLASSDPDDLWVRRVALDDVNEVAPLVWQVWGDEARPSSAPGVPVEVPLVLVCTHGRRDACCAKWGRPLATWFAEQGGVDVWETTHTGGHRFAPNVVILPHGYVYGRVDLRSAPELLAKHLAGTLDLDHLRGRCALDPWEQVAEIEMRRRAGLTEDRDLRVVATSRSDETARVQVRAGGRTYVVEVVKRPTGLARSVSCGAEETDPGRLDVVGVEVLDEVRAPIA